ncbi:MAG TPA: TAXI family TRAP transporter solute-binding subunit [Burkholderiales bacterium]|nr:TAXI family TRAP transporter solute-binding subunit [Burkholderiales bacterium]
MPRLLRDTLISFRDLLATAGPLLLLTLALLVGAYLVLKPQPPKHVVLATGSDQSSYAELGARYAAELKRNGIRVTLLPTLGSLENLRDLRDPKQRVDFGFVKGGSSAAARVADEEHGGVPLVSLGSLFYEPLWIFYRAPEPLADLGALRGLRVNLGARGSGTPGLMRKLLEANGIDRDSLRATYLDLTPAVVALLGGETDLVAFTSAPEAAMVQMLLQTPGVRLLEFPQAEAYARRFPFLSAVVLPRGVADLAHDVPPHDVPLIATTTSLLARADTHPALVQLFVQAAARIHGGAGWIVPAGRFPSPQSTEFPLAPEAERYYRSGPPLLQRYLPFWLANLIDRMWVALFSIVAVLIPLSRVVPPVYRFRIRSRIFRWYRQLRQIEDRLGRAEAPPAQLLGELDRLEAKARGIAVPLSHTDELYELRSHIALVRARLQQNS